MINLSMAEPDNMLRPRITVVGVGGGGGNAINNMITSNLEGCEFIAANTDAQALAQSMADRKIQLGSNLSRGLGAGSKPDIGCAAAEEALSDIMGVLDGSDMMFVTAGMGGGTGTGAAPVVARAARDSGILTVGVVTKPFHFEGPQRMRQAEAGIAELQKYVDTLIVIPNQNLFRIANERTTFSEAFRLADEVLHSGVRGITDLMVMPGFMNLDFADVKTVMGEMGKAMMGTGEGEGDNRAIEAAEAAISNPLLDDISMKGARGVLINITGGLDMTLFEVDQAANRIREEVASEAQIKVGSTLGEGMDGQIRVSVIATGIDVETENNKSSQGGGGSVAAPVRTKVSVQTQSEATPKKTFEPAKTAVDEEYVEPVKSESVRDEPARGNEENSFEDNANTGRTDKGYFTMPAPMNPKVTDSLPAASVTVRQQERANALEIQEEVINEAHQAVEQIASEVNEVDGYRSSASQGELRAAPVREIPPVQEAQRQRTAGAQNSRRSDSDGQDMRITQLTTAAPAHQKDSYGSQTGTQRAQSLFQRITGFGMVRPSVQAEDGMDSAPQAAQSHLEIDPSDRQSLSATESDQLDIPAFLRRQSNH